ncbi:MAG: HIT family protein [Gammaproteobacteria bacterium]|nr:HIT family protein [Gammaproteobacteria bacterium]
MLDCPLCKAHNEQLLWRDNDLRIILADEPDYPGFCRVVWNAHVREMTDLDPEARVHFMNAVFAVEQAVRELVRPDKINLASLGNQVPHLHWHVIPRFIDDPHFPDPIWAPARRAPRAGGVERAALAHALATRLA